MFTICHSNHLDLLEQLAARIMKDTPLPEIFSSETIVVQSQGMAKWLQVQFANDLSIAANLSFVFPGQFIWQMYHHLIPDVPEKSDFDRDRLVWKLLQLLPECIALPEFSLLADYFKGAGSERKYYPLARQIAELYDSYLVYRPEWITTWESGKYVDPSDENEIWQAKLWLKIKAHSLSLAQSHMHRAAVNQTFISLLESGKLTDELYKGLPKRVFIFGITSLPPPILSALAALGKHTDIYLMLTNPCRWYWGDMPDEKWLRKITQKQCQNLSHHSEAYFLKPMDRHPLLSLLGKLGRDALFLLQEYDHKNDVEMFIDIEADTMLHQLQQQILDLDDRSILGIDPSSFETSKKKITVRSDDFSIAFHSCHSAQREVEILYNDLLDKFDSDPTLSLRDVIVMMPDIDTYAASIKAVFGSAPSHRYLPFSLCDRKVEHVDPSISAFLFLLNLPACRFTCDEIFDLLSVPAISRHFKLNEGEIIQLKEWCNHAGIRWGFDDEMLHAQGMTTGSRFTWRFGLERLLLGSIMETEDCDWQGIVPYEGSVGQAAESVGKLVSFVEKLRFWVDRFAMPRVLSEWQSAGSRLLEDFFERTAETEPVLILLEKEWQAMLNDGIESGYSRTLPLTVVQQAMEDRLNRTRLDQRFLTGKINFCTLLPMRGIPFRVVCLLGMNDGAYPRLTPKPSFDLIAQRPKRGDRSRREDDLYLFLESLMAAKSHLYISYIGKDVVDNHVRYPSVLVDALRDYIGQTFVLEKDREENSDVSSERLKAHLTLEHPRTPYSPENYRIDPSHNQVGCYMEEWFAAAGKQGDPCVFVTPLPQWSIDRVTIDELKSFYKHSVKGILQKRFEIFFSVEDASLPSSELFSLEGLERYKVNERILESTLQNCDVMMKVGQSITAEGKLPHGVFGELALEDAQQKMRRLADRINLKTSPVLKQEVELQIRGITLEGWIEYSEREGLLRAKPGKLSAADGISLWIDHVILSSLRSDLQISSQLYGIDEATWSYAPLPERRAEDILNELIDGYLNGMNAPLLLPVKSAWAWLEQCYDPETGQIDNCPVRQKKARAHLIRTWEGNTKTRPECDDYYFRLVPELTEDHVDVIEKNARLFLLPMRQARSD